MDLFQFFSSGTANWVEVVLVAGAGVVFWLYLYQLFLPKIRSLLGTRPDPEERTAQLLDRYRRQKQAEEEKS